jgi:hypothetical protein
MKLYKGCLESNESMFVCFLPDKVLKWNRTQTIAQNRYFVSILWSVIWFLTLILYNATSAGHVSEACHFRISKAVLRTIFPAESWAFSWNVKWVSLTFVESCRQPDIRHYQTRAVGRVWNNFNGIYMEKGPFPLHLWHVHGFVWMMMFVDAKTYTAYTHPWILNNSELPYSFHNVEDI